MITTHKTQGEGGRPACRRAFTLIELLVVMVIMALLSAMVLGALFSAYDTAKLAKTKATISKIHNQLAHRWDSYRTRRLPVSIQSAAGETPQQFAARRLLALWELQRIEMPDDASDLTFPPDAAVFGPVVGQIGQNPLRKAYVDQLVLYGKSPGNMVGGKNVSAECLYLMVTVGMNAEDEVRFLDNEIGDTDNNGIPEFIDGWGRPIRWIRWAPGFVPRLGADTDIQRDDPLGATPLPGGASPPSFLADPFDPRGLCRPGAMNNTVFGPGVPPIPSNPPSAYSKSNPPVYGFKLMPLVYSAGPDGEYGIEDFQDNNPPLDPTFAWNPYSCYADNNHTPYLPVGDLQNGVKWPGTPIKGIEGGGHMDNITNHRLGTR